MLYIMTVENSVDFRVTFDKALINKWRAKKDKSLVFELQILKRCLE